MNNYQIKNIQHGSENKCVVVIKQLNALADELVWNMSKENWKIQSIFWKQNGQIQLMKNNTKFLRINIPKIF